MGADALSHPDDGNLRAFARGALDDRDLDRIAEHLERCETCRKAVDGVVADNRFLSRLRSARTVVGDFVEDQAQRRRVVRALRRELGRPPDTAGDTAAADPPPPRRVGDYLIVREVGRGGMGVVYQARHGGLGRLVALKMILAGGFASETQRQRFRREAELAARVQHPNIVQVYEVGLHDGRPFLAMEWVDGGTLADRLGGDPWPPRAAAGLIEGLAWAIEAAHRRGVVHRDLKPSNILLQSDGDASEGGPLGGATPKVADFGLARPMDGERGLTSTGLALGTPEYMAPEQAAGAQAGPAADVYALGAILYQLLTGRPPFRGETAMEVLQALASAEPLTPRRLQPRLERDLETIALKAIEKEPARRYATAAAMAEDLRRFLAGEPIRARSPTAWDRLAKWARRRPALAALTAALAAVTVVAFTGITALWIEAAAARDQARAAAALAQSRGAAERRGRYRAAIAAAAGALELNHIEAAHRFLEEAPVEHRDWEWRHFAAQLDNTRGSFRPADGPVCAFALAPRGRRVAYAVTGGHDVRVRALVDGNDLAVLRGHQAAVISIAFSADGSRVAAGAADHTVRVWGVADGRQAASLPVVANDPESLVFAPEGSRLIAFGGGTARFWDLVGGRCLAVLRAVGAPFGPDGRRFVAVGDWHARLMDASSGAVLRDLTRPGERVACAAFSPDGRRVATGSLHPACAVCLWDADRDGPPVVLSGHKNSVLWLAFSLDGQMVASASSDRTVRLWDTATAKGVAVLSGHQDDVLSGTFSPDGRRLVTVDRDRTARAWDTAEGTPLGVFRCHAPIDDFPKASQDGSVVAVADEHGAVHFWDVELATRRGLLRGHTSYVYDVAVSPDGRTVASAAWDGTVRLWSADDGRELSVLRHAEPLVSAVALSPSGEWCASVGRDHLVRLWNLATGRTAWSHPLPGLSAGLEYRIAFNPTGDRLTANPGADKLVQLFDTATGRPVATLAGHEADVTDAIFSPDGTRLVSADRDGTVRFWTTDGYAPLTTFKAHDQHIFRLALSPDGLILATASSDRTVRLWDAGTGRKMAMLRHGAPVYGLAFNPDGTRLAAACGDGTVRVWDVATFAEVAELRGHGDYVHAVAFSPDGNRLVSASGDYTVRIWNALPSKPLDRLSIAPARK